MSYKSNSLWGELANSYAPYGYTGKHCKHHKKSWGVAHLTPILLHHSIFLSVGFSDVLNAH